MFGQIQAEIDLAEQLARLVRNVRAQTGDVKRDGLERAAAVCEAVQRRNIPEHVGKDVVRTRGADETFQQIVVSELLGAAAGLRVLVGVMNTICPSPIGATRMAYRAPPMLTSEM